MLESHSSPHFSVSRLKLKLQTISQVRPNSFVVSEEMVAF